VVCKIDVKRDDDIDAASENTDAARKVNYTGYIGMLAVETNYRRAGIGTALALRAIQRMQQMGCQSIQLETEVTNKGAMRLYEDRLGFIREELLVKYYLNWNNAYRLRLWLK
jgi:peptide alpha-N-acetyltransferase